MDFNNILFTTFYNVMLSMWRHNFELIVSFFFGIIAYFITLYFIQPVRIKLIERHIFGIDINKTTYKERRELNMKQKNYNFNILTEKEKKLIIPESLGILAGTIYLTLFIIMITIIFGFSMRKLDGAIITITVMLLLGFVDDILDLRWRHKLLLSTVGALPLIFTYEGSLFISIPKPFIFYFNTSYIYLGIFYLIYLILLCVFCTNSINILAGINGIEIGQSIIIGFTCIIYNILQLRLENNLSYIHIDKNNTNNINKEESLHHLMAIALLTPFIGVSLALWRYNKYPASIFVGDSYTYFAGTVLAVSGICGQYSKTLLLFFTPQTINFIISLPQLFHIIPCPRHRVPKWDSDRDVLMNSGNYTLLNAFLWFYGDMNERLLTQIVLKFQICCSVFAFIVRYLFAAYLYDYVR